MTTYLNLSAKIITISEQGEGDSEVDTIDLLSNSGRYDVRLFCEVTEERLLQAKKYIEDSKSIFGCNVDIDALIVRLEQYST